MDNMRLSLVLIVLLLSVSSAQTLDPAPDSTRTDQIVDPWFGFDKVQHFTFSFLWTLSSQYVIETKMEIHNNRTIYYSAGSAFSIGLLKEFHDKDKPGGFFSKRDLIADGLGIICGVIIILI